jgi:hypothetical protein
VISYLAAETSISPSKWRGNKYSTVFRSWFPGAYQPSLTQISGILSH